MSIPLHHQLSIDWLIAQGFTPYRQNDSHSIFFSCKMLDFQHATFPSSSFLNLHVHVLAYHLLIFTLLSVIHRALCRSYGWRCIGKVQRAFQCCGKIIHILSRHWSIMVLCNIRCIDADCGKHTFSCSSSWWP